MKVTYYVAMSTDEFIAKQDGDVSWLDELDIEMTDTGYDEFFSSVNGLVMGRHTYDFVYNYGSWPYGDKPTWIFTSGNLKVLEGANLKKATTVEEALKEMESEGLKHIWLVGGGDLASSFLEKGLLTNLIISEMPVNLGDGIPLFARYKLERIPALKTEEFKKKGFKQLEITL